MNEKSRAKTKTFSLRNDLINTLSVEAEKENRSTSNYMETVLLKHFKEKGIKVSPSL